MELEIGNLIVKANRYKDVLQNTIVYRTQWNESLKPMIVETLKDIVDHLGIKAEVKSVEKITNLESIVLDLGKTSSGISENMEDTDVKRTMIKSNGALVYQQLFNGKVMIMIVSPYIEGYGEPKPPITLEILRPDELKKPFIVRHLEALIKDITEWEDFDDDQPPKSPLGFNPIGFNREEEPQQ